MTDLRFHGNRQAEGVFSITADGVLFFNGEQVGRIVPEMECIPHPQDRFSHRTIRFVAQGITLKAGPKWDDKTYLSTSIASTSAAEVIVSEVIGRTLSDSAISQVIRQYEHTARANAKTTTTHDVIAEVTDPENLWEVLAEICDTANECGYGDLTDADRDALQDAAEPMLARMRERCQLCGEPKHEGDTCPNTDETGRFSS